MVGVLRCEIVRRSGSCARPDSGREWKRTSCAAVPPARQVADIYLGAVRRKVAWVKWEGFQGGHQAGTVTSCTTTSPVSSSEKRRPSSLSSCLSVFRELGAGKLDKASANLARATGISLTRG